MALISICSSGGGLSAGDRVLLHGLMQQVPYRLTAGALHCKELIDEDERSTAKDQAKRTDGVSGVLI